MDKHSLKLCLQAVCVCMSLSVLRSCSDELAELGMLLINDRRVLPLPLQPKGPPSKACDSNLSTLCALGWHAESRGTVQVYNPKMGMDALQVFPCSQAASNQRAGELLQALALLQTQPCITVGSSGPSHTSAGFRLPPIRVLVSICKPLHAGSQALHYCWICWVRSSFTSAGSRLPSRCMRTSPCKPLQTGK